MFINSPPINNGRSSEPMSRRYQQPIPRDRSIPEPGAWDALNAVYIAMQDFAKLPLSVSKLLRDKEAVSRVENKELLIERAQTLLSDCTKKANDLIAINATHRNRRGDPLNADDNVRCMNVHEQYLQWASDYEAVVYPTFTAITQQVGDVVGVDFMQMKPTDIVTFNTPAEPQNQEDQLNDQSAD